MLYTCINAKHKSVISKLKLTINGNEENVVKSISTLCRWKCYSIQIIDKTKQLLCYMIKMLSGQILPVNSSTLRLHIHVLLIEYFPFPINDSRFNAIPFNKYSI